MRQDLLECRSRRNGVGTRKAGSFQPRCDGWWNAPLADSRSGAGSPSPTSGTSRTSSILLGSLSPASSPLASHARPRRAMSTIFAKHALKLLVVPLDPPARRGDPHERLQRGAPGEVGEPVLGRLGVSLRPLDQQPLLRPGFG